MATKGVNKAIILGNVGKDPEVRTVGEGTTVANLSIATSESWKDKSGDKVEETTWHRVVFWRKLAEIVEQYVKKGDKLYIEGKIINRSYEKDGTTRYITEIVADQMQMLGSPGGASRSSEPRRDEQTPPPEEFDDDIPF